MAKKLSDVLAGTNKSRTRPGSTGTRPGLDYASKMKDERDFVASHEVQEFDDRVGNGSDVYNASNIKHNPDDRHGHIPKPEDEKQYKQANEQTMTSSPRPVPRPGRTLPSGGYQYPNGAVEPGPGFRPMSTDTDSGMTSSPRPKPRPAGLVANSSSNTSMSDVYPPRGDLEMDPANMAPESKLTVKTSPRPKPRPVFAEAKKEYEEDATDEKEMMMNQLNFIKLASEKIKGHINSTKDPEEWFQNKLSGLHANMKDLHAYVAGEKDEVKEDYSSKTAPEVGTRHNVDEDGSIGVHVVTGVADNVVNTQNIKTKEKFSTPLRDWHSSSSPIKEEVELDENLGKASKKMKFMFNTDPRDVKQRIKGASPEFREQIRNTPGKLGGPAELQRRLARKMKEEVDLDEAQVKKPTSYERAVALPDGEPDKSAKMGVNKAAYAAASAVAKPKSKVSLKKAPWDMKKEEVEQIDELDKKTYGSYAKKAKDDLGKRESEITRNMFVDPKGVKDPIKHNNSLLMKRAKRRDYINTAIDKLTKEEVEGDPRVEPKDVKSKGKSLKMITGQVKESNHNGSRTKTGTEQARARFDKKMERKEMQKDQEDDN
jgi:hypothetical protein